MERKIWLYWEGPQPAYISLCLRTFLANNNDVVVLNRDDFDRLHTVDRDIPIEDVHVAQRTDFIRAYLLKHFGGLYVDLDCIVTCNLSGLLDLAEQHSFVGYREPLWKNLTNNLMASKAHGAIICDLYDRICKTLRNKRPLQWLDLSSVPLEAALNRYPGEAFLLPTETVMPISWHTAEAFSIQRSDKEHSVDFRQDAYCYMLSNNTIKGHPQTKFLCAMPERYLLSANYFISFLYRKALGLTS